MREFTADDLFPYGEDSNTGLLMCFECGCGVLNYGSALHIKWHNKVADL